VPRSAFYFSSKAADEARKDILAASLPSTVTPNLIGDKPAAVNAKLAGTSLRLRATPANPGANAVAFDQAPLPNENTAVGTTVAVTFAGPVPSLLNMKPGEARAALQALYLDLDPDPVDAGEGTKVAAAGDQDPAPDGDVPPNRKVKAKFS
jgi:hypothetical protein